MTPAVRKQLRAKLQALRAEVLEAEPAKIEPTRRDPAVAGVADTDEQALTEMLQVLASSRNKKQAELLVQVDKALRKLDTTPEEFGLCEECEEELPLRRLELMPYVALCIECQSSHDPARGVSRRKLTDFH